VDFRIICPFRKIPYNKIEGHRTSYLFADLYVGKISKIREKEKKEKKLIFRRFPTSSKAAPPSFRSWASPCGPRSRRPRSGDDLMNLWFGRKKRQIYKFNKFYLRFTEKCSPKRTKNNLLRQQQPKFLDLHNTNERALKPLIMCTIMFDTD
jgi:hypothetical protein